jgi:hypothetical protein
MSVIFGAEPWAISPAPAIPHAARLATAIEACSAANRSDYGVHTPPTDSESAAATANRRLAIPAPPPT